MSLCAMGMPSSGPESPAARRSSAAWACAMAASRSTVRNALRRAFSASMRSSTADVSSTLDSVPAARAALSSAMVESSMTGPRGGFESGQQLDRLQLLDDLRHEVEAVFGCRRVLLED